MYRYFEVLVYSQKQKIFTSKKINEFFFNFSFTQKNLNKIKKKKTKSLLFR